jgi:hypothetical protein
VHAPVVARDGCVLSIAKDGTVNMNANVENYLLSISWTTFVERFHIRAVAILIRNRPE